MTKRDNWKANGADKICAITPPELPQDWFMLDVGSDLFIQNYFTNWLDQTRPNLQNVFTGVHGGIVLWWQQFYYLKHIESAQVFVFVLTFIFLPPACFLAINEHCIATRVHADSLASCH